MRIVRAMVIGTLLVGCAQAADAGDKKRAPAAAAASATHETTKVTELYDHPAQGRPPEPLAAGTRVIVQADDRVGGYVRIQTADGKRKGYVPASDLKELAK